MVPGKITIDHLVWDDFNRHHIAKHDVTIEEVIEVVNNYSQVIMGKNNRLIAVGKTSKGRILAVVVEQSEPKGYYVVTARSASRKERKLY